MIGWVIAFSVCEGLIIFKAFDAFNVLIDLFLRFIEKKNMKK